MGLVLDVASACALSFLLFMLVFLSTGKNPAVCALLSLAASFFVGVAAHRLLKKKARLTGRRKRLLADRYVKSLCFMDADKALAEAYRLLSAKYPLTNERCESGRVRFTHADTEEAVLTVVQKLKAGPDDLLSAWRAQGRGSGVNHMVILVPGRSEQDARVISMRLKQPDVLMLDRRQLRALARKHANLRENAAKPVYPHPLRALSACITRRRAGRYLFYALLLNLYYFITGGVLYLAAGVSLLAVSAVSLKKQAQPERLME